MKSAIEMKPYLSDCAPYFSVSSISGRKSVCSSTERDRGRPLRPSLNTN